MDVKMAYFSAEFGLADSLPIYSGGLGILAGDHVKAAADLGLPLVGVGILYRKGYFTQRIREDGTQEALYPDLQPDRLPVAAVLNSDGSPLLIKVPIGDRQVAVRVWQVKIGEVSVYLMDADIAVNQEKDRRLTDSLYGGDQELRISQEIILGIGGVRVLRALGIAPEVWHINEGHVALLTLERIREYMAHGATFEAALEVVKAGTLFTTHTPVPAGHDVFSFELVDRYLHSLYGELGGRDKVLGLGRVGDQFNMTRLAVRTSAKVNGVSKLHAQVTKELFHRWTPEIPPQDIPVDYVTNGIHTATWLGDEMKELFDRYLDQDWDKRVGELEVWLGVGRIPDQELWDAHRRAKERMLRILGITANPQVLCIGFARRFAAYKRALLLFGNPERLEGLLNHADRPVVLIFAGKAHPADWHGQDLMRRIVEYAKLDQFKGKIFFVENYSIGIAQHLVQGVDLWLNTPLKPLEASGTSGQKAAVNGVLNCSVLDGWWNEGYNGQNGWAIQGVANGGRDEQDRVDRDTLYWLLEEVIAPLYYRRNEQGLPTGWIAMMKESISSLAPVYNTARMVAEYRDRFYLPLMERVRYFQANDLQTARRVAAFKGFIRQNWEQVQVLSVELTCSVGGCVEDCTSLLLIRAKIRLGPIWFKDVRVQAVGSDGYGGIWKYELRHTSEQEHGVHLFEGTFPHDISTWRRSNANVRIVPVSPDFNSDFELELTRWGQFQWR